jgi:hypothetical protein
MLTHPQGFGSLCMSPLAFIFISIAIAYSCRPIPLSIGIGILYAATTYPVLAPLPPSLAGQALAFMVFVRSFGNVLGITVGAYFSSIGFVPGCGTNARSQVPWSSRMNSK